MLPSRPWPGTPAPRTARLPPQVDPSGDTPGHRGANPTGADCQVCHVNSTDNHTTGTITFVGHPATWTDKTNAGFHAYEANKGLAKCQGCHGADLSGGSTGFSCAMCHDTALPAGVTSWKVNCVGCHGGTGNQTGAPPRATWGKSADAVRVGAHATHVAGTPAPRPSTATSAT